MVRDLSIQDFKAMRAGGDAYTLLDVRRDDELALAKYPEPYLHIEMSEVAARLAEIPTDKPIIVACRSGGRSAKVAVLLQEKGFQNISNLTGGILAWAELDGENACPI
ncbi:MAG TPA: rhodanese-like domain-containing protein [Alphaproteobacteria bacterium]|nr:rhodanese-like domain-containing protein [Alphaproteobacteria bacterium]